MVVDIEMGGQADRLHKGLLQHGMQLKSIAGIDCSTKMLQDVINVMRDSPRPVTLLWTALKDPGDGAGDSGPVGGVWDRWRRCDDCPHGKTPRSGPRAEVSDAAKD